ncbi:hypothetical protein CAPTEDRAFT_124094, partial [Capitella teleta]
CCQEIRQTRGMAAEESTQCITEHEGFSEICLARHALRAVYNRYHQCYRKSIPNEENKRSRFMAYRMMVYWCWGFLGKELRVPLPSCAVSAIRQKFPSENGDYTGFNYE